MSFTILQVPDQLAATYRQQIYQVRSDDNSIVRAIADIRVEGKYEVTIEKDIKLDTSNIFDFDISRIGQDFLSTDIVTDYSADTIEDFIKSSKEFRLRFFEVLQGVGNTLDTSWAPNGLGTDFKEASSNKNLVNATLQHEDIQDLDRFTLRSTTRKFLTNKPRNKFEIERGDPFQLDFLELLTPLRFRFEQFRADGSFSSAPFLSPDLSLTNGKGAIVIDTSALDSDAVKFKLHLSPKFADGFSIISEVITINIISECKDTTKFYWENALGGIDYFSFKGRKTRSVQARATTFEQIIEQGFAKKDRGVTIHNIDSSIKREAWSGTADSTTLEWLQELITHQANVWIRENGDFFPVIIDRGSSKLFFDNDDRVTDIKIVYTLANKPIGQGN